MWKWVLASELEGNTDNTIWNKRYNRGCCTFLKESGRFYARDVYVVSDVKAVSSDFNV